MKETYFAGCSNGVFELPPALFEQLQELVPRGFVYVRHDQDCMTISSTRLVDGRRRPLTNHFRSPLLRNATRVAILDTADSLRVMPVEWK